MFSRLGTQVAEDKPTKFVYTMYLTVNFSEPGDEATACHVHVPPLVLKSETPTCTIGDSAFCWD